MYAEERRVALVDMARRHGRVAVAEAAANFDVTPETIRRDLELLDQHNSLRRVHGGAIPVDSPTLGDVHVSDRENTAIAEKSAIALAAVRLLPADAQGSLILDAGTTTARVAREIPPGDWTIFTNSLPIASLLSQRKDVDLELLGGRVRGVTQAAVGATPLALLRVLRVDMAFIGTNGLTMEHGLSTPNPAEAEVKAQMVRSARRVVVVTDSRKLGAEATVSFADAEHIDVLVTDEGIPMSLQEELQHARIEVVIA